MPAGSASALAAARAAASGRRVPPGPVAVLEVGPVTVRATVLVLGGAAGGTVLAHRRTEVRDTGDDRWAALAVALLAAAAADSGHDPPSLTGGVVLAGALARAVGLAERVADLVGEPPVLSDDLVTAGLPVARAAGPTPRPGRPPSRSPRLAGHRPPPGKPERILGAGLIPPVVRRRNPRSLLAGTAVTLLAGLLALVVVWRYEAAAPEPPVSGVGAASMLAQYDYTMRVPGGWRHSGGLPERRRTLLTPAAAPAGTDLISVEQTPLGYDSDAERDRAFRELRERYHQAQAAGSQLDELTMATRVAGRDVIAYRQRQPLRGADVDWYVLFDRDAQLSVGCQHTPAGADAVRAACADVIAALHRRR